MFGPLQESSFLLYEVRNRLKDPRESTNKLLVEIYKAKEALYELIGDTFILTRAVFKIIGAYLALNKGSKRFFLFLERPIFVYKLLYEVGY